MISAPEVVVERIAAVIGRGQSLADLAASAARAADAASVGAVVAATSMALICAVAMFVRVPFPIPHFPSPAAQRRSMSALIASQRAFVRDAISSSPNTSGFWAIFAAATPATPPAPMSNTLAISFFLRQLVGE